MKVFEGKRRVGNTLRRHNSSRGCKEFKKPLRIPILQHSAEFIDRWLCPFEGTSTDTENELKFNLIDFQQLNPMSETGAAACAASTLLFRRDDGGDGQGPHGRTRPSAGHTAVGDTTWRPLPGMAESEVALCPDVTSAINELSVSEES